MANYVLIDTLSVEGTGSAKDPFDIHYGESYDNLAKFIRSKRLSKAFIRFGQGLVFVQRDDQGRWHGEAIIDPERDITNLVYALNFSVSTYFDSLPFPGQSLADKLVVLTQGQAQALLRAAEAGSGIHGFTDAEYDSIVSAIG